VSRRVFLHIGSPKTGTTFLQQVVWSQKAALRAAGLLLPGRAFNDHWLGYMDVRGAHDDTPQSVGVWSGLVQEVAEWDGDSLLSHELFAGLADDVADRAAADLSGACDELHVVITARDMARQIPAEWQEHLKHRSTMTYDLFLEHVRTRGPRATWFWRVQDVPALAGQWAERVGARRTHVITVPSSSSSPEVLWGRFATTLGLHPADFSLDVPHANASVGLEQAELLRRLNAELGERLARRGAYSVLVKDQLVHKMLAHREGTRLVLPKVDFDFAVAHGEEVVRDLGVLGVDVVGELDDLVPSADEPPPDTLPQVAVDDVLQEAVAALATTLHALDTTRADLRRARAALPPPPPPPPDPQVNPLRRGLVALSRRSRTVDAAKRLYKRHLQRDAAR
jgi:hypothetical protein